MRNPALTAIGAYALIDPPDAEKKEELSGYSNIGESKENTEYSNIGESKENTEYSNIGETQKIEPKKRCVF